MSEAAVDQVSFRRNGRPGAAADHRCRDLGSIQKRLRRQMCIALGHADLGMPEEVLNHVERYALIDQKARERVAQIMKPQIAETCTPPDAGPRVEQRSRRAASARRGENVLVSRHAGYRPQRRQGCTTKRNRPRLAGLRQRHQQRAALPVHMLPFGVGDFVTPGTGQQQQLDGLGCHLIVVSVDGGHEPLRLLGGQEALPVDLRGQAKSRGRIGAGARHVPFAGEIENIAQEHDDAIAGARGFTVRLHLRDQSDDLVAADAIDGEMAQRRQDVNSQQSFIKPPTALAAFRVRQIPLADELCQRRGQPQLLTTDLRISTKQSLSYDRATLALGLVERQHVSRTDLELTLPAGRIDVALIVGLATGLADFEKESALFRVEEIDLLTVGGTRGLPRQLGREGHDGHLNYLPT